MVSGVETLLLEVLPVFIIAAAVGIFVANVWEFPYTIALLLAGLAVSILGVVTDLVTIDIRLSHDIIFLVLLPPLLFEGAATTDLAQFRRHFSRILALSTAGLLISIGILGVLGQYAFGYPLLVSLLFAATVLQTDPVSVLALFDELGVPDRLAVVTRSEAEEVYELLLGRVRAVDAALAAVERLHGNGEIPTEMYEAFTTEYEREKRQLRTVIPALLAAYPEVGREELMMDERRVLQPEKSAVLDAIRIGVVSDEVGERLLEETNLKLDRVEAGESTVMDGRKGYDEVWRERVRELGIEVDEPDGDADKAAREE